MHRFTLFASFILTISAACARRCTGLDDHSGDLVFASDTNFCSMLLGSMECNFECQSKPVVVSENYENTAHPLILDSARRIHLPPICISWIIIRNSARVSTVRGLTDDQHCGYWLRIENSESFGLDYGIVDLSVQDSDIGYINLPRLRQLNINNSSISSIDHAEVMMFPSTIRNSRVKDIFFINITVADLKISNSTIDTIGPGSIIFNGLNLVFEDVSIRNLENRGINMLSGNLIMRNCLIGNVAEYAIVAEDSKVTLRDVTINVVEKPGFHFRFAQEVSFTNVTVGGETIRSDSAYVRYLISAEDFQDVENEAIITGFTNRYCSFKLGILQCEFLGINKPVVFERNSPPPQFISISNAAMLRAVGDFSCSHVNIINCTGRFISLVNSTCPSGGKLSVVASNLTTISSNTATSLSINSSSVATLHVASIKSLNIVHSTILSVYDVTVDREASWGQSHFLQVSSLTLKGSCRIQDCKFDRISSLELNTEGDSVSFLNTTINSIYQRRSVWVRSGNLSMKNVTVVDASPAGVYLENGATLVLSNVSFSLLVFGAISASRIEQVTSSSDDPMAGDYHSLTQKRSADDQMNIREPLGAYTADAYQPYCTQNASRLVCDYTLVPNAAVVWFSNASCVTLQSPSSVILRPTGMQSVVVSDVQSVAVEDPAAVAELDLFVTNSTLENITTAVHSFSIEDSSVNFLSLSPDQMLMIFITSSCRLAKLIVQTQEASCTSTQFGDIYLLSANFIELVNSTIKSISPAGFVIHQEGILDFCIIKNVEDRGIVVHGKITLSHVFIATSENNSVVILEGGSLVMKNVTIHSNVRCPFFILGEVTHVSDFLINGKQINSAESFLQHCGVDKASQWKARNHVQSQEVNGDDDTNDRKLLLGLAVTSIILMFLAATVLVIIRSFRFEMRPQLPLVLWRNSSETLVYSGLTQNEELPPEVPGDINENSRLVEPEDG